MSNLIKRFLLMFTCMLFLGFSLNAKVAGRVIDKNGSILQGVLITSEHGKNTSITDQNGDYNISVTDGSSFIKFSLLGYVSQTLDISEVIGGGKNVVLESTETYNLEENVILGSFAQTKETATGSVATVAGEVLGRSPVANLSQSLAGRLPGLLTREVNSEPILANTQLLLRGYSSPNGGTALVVIDGVPYDYSGEQLFDYISAAEIESVTVLKDAASQVLYGIHGGNGVIVITTKRGAEQGLKIDVAIDHTLQQRTTNPTFIHSADFSHLRNLSGTRDRLGGYYYFNEQVMDGLLQGKNRNYFPNSNWRELNAKDITQLSRVNVNLTGGNDRVLHYTNINLMNQEGMWKMDPVSDQKNSNNGFMLANLRSNIDLKLSDMFTLGVNISGIVKSGKVTGGEAAINDPGYAYNGVGNRIWRGFYSLPSYVFGSTIPEPTIPLLNVAVGETVVTESQPITSWALINRMGYNQYTVSNINLQLAPKLDLSSVAPGLSADAIIGYQINSVAGKLGTASYEKWVRTDNYNQLLFNKLGSDTNEPVTFETETNSYSNLNVKGAVNYEKNINGEHDLDLALYGMFQQLSGIGSSSSYSWSTAGVGAGYGFNNRYLLRANVGVSGTGEYSRSNSMVLLPALSAAWVVSNEAFLEDNEVLSYLKIRGSWGQTANDWGLTRYQHLSNMGLAGSGFGFVGAPELVLEYSKFDPEIITKMNVGLDITLLNEITFSLDLYDEKTTNAVINLDPTFAGDNPNTGEYENRGFELSLGYDKRLNNDLGFSAGGWLAFNQNKITSWDETSLGAGYAYKNRIEGYPVGQEWGYVVNTYDGENGYFNTLKQIEMSGITYAMDDNLLPGSLRYYDVNADYVIDEKDMVPLGKGALPNFFYAFNAGLNYKNFDLNLLFQGVADYWTVDRSMGRVEYEYEGVYTDWHRYAWTYERYMKGETIKYPSLSGEKNSNHESSTHFLEDKSYLRLKNVELGYTFDQFYGLRLYFSGQNLLTFDKLKHKEYGPEAHYSGGIGAIPVYRMYNVGVSLNF